MSTDRHKTKPKAVRMPDGLLAWYEQHAEATGRSVNAALVGALEEHRTRHDSGSTTPAASATSGTTTRKPRADTAPPAAFRPPQPQRCTHPGTRIIGGYCKDCDHMIEPGGLWRTAR